MHWIEKKKSKKTVSQCSAMWSKWLEEWKKKSKSNKSKEPENFEKARTRLQARFFSLIKICSQKPTHDGMKDRKEKHQPQKMKEGRLTISRWLEFNVLPTTEGRLRKIRIKTRNINYTRKRKVEVGNGFVADGIKREKKMVTSDCEVDSTYLFQ